MAIARLSAKRNPLELNGSEFRTAVGQFINYRVALEERQPERLLYLAVPISVYRQFFRLTFVKTIEIL